MEIRIIDATRRPLDVIARAAGTSYGKDDPKESRVESCVALGHDSVLEHASVTFKVRDISRSCSHQLVRHRMASYCQLSQRYTRLDANREWFVVPPSVQESETTYGMFVSSMLSAEEEYMALLDRGVKPEDARYVLPEATKTDITVTMNVRELFHFLDLRTDEHAQWEIRDMANMLVGTIEEIGGQWLRMMKMREER